MATEATETKVRRNETHPNERGLPNLIRPRAETNQLDGALRFRAFLLILIGSCFIINPMGHDFSSVQNEAFLVLALIILGFLLLFMSVMIAGSPLITAFAAFVVKLTNTFVLGDA